MKNDSKFLGDCYVKPIELNENLLIGRGNNKDCYLHPENKDWCIKVLLNQNNKSTRKHILQEIKYLKKIKRLSLNAVVKYIGTENTNLGCGYVFECVRDTYVGGGDGFTRKYIKKLISLFK
jgi:hypothetical protein